MERDNSPSSHQDEQQLPTKQETEVRRNVDPPVVYYIVQTAGAAQWQGYAIPGQYY